MALDPLRPFSGASEGGGLTPAQRFNLPTFDILKEAQGFYGPRTVTRAINPDVLQELQRDVSTEAEFRGRADMLAQQQFALATRGLPHHQVSLMRQSLLPSLMLGAMQNQDLRARYQRERYGFDPFTRRFLGAYEEEHIPGEGNQRRAIDLLRQSAARPEPRLGEGIETIATRYGGGS